MSTMILRSKSNRSSANSSQPIVKEAASGSSSAVSARETFDNLSPKELVLKAIELNKDPIVADILLALSEEIPKDFSDIIKEEERSRSVVIVGLAESDDRLRPSECQAELESKVGAILDVLKVECRPSSVYRMGQRSNAKPRLVKVVLPTTTHWRLALRNARLLRHSSFKTVHIRKSMTPEELKRDGELRMEARNRNRECGTRQWVVYKSELKRITELPFQKPDGSLTQGISPTSQFAASQPQVLQH